MNEEEDSFPNFHFLAELVSKGIISQKTMDKVKIGTSVIERKYKLKESQYNNHEKIEYQPYFYPFYFSKKTQNFFII